jgi:transcriptional regulator with XRE-family HTH domain
MAGKEINLGPIGVNLANTVREIREGRRYGYAELSRRLAELGREIAPLGLRRIESGERRVDADDLFALAVALNVSPLVFLLPRGESRVTPEGDEYPADLIRQWATGERALAGEPTPDDTPGGRATMFLDYIRYSNPVMWEAMIQATPIEIREGRESQWRRLASTKSQMGQCFTASATAHPKAARPISADSPRNGTRNVLPTRSRWRR